MSKPNSQFTIFIQKQTKTALLFAYSLVLITILYPGHNQLQTITLNPGSVFSYTPPSLPLAPYPVADGTNPPPVTATSYIVQDMVSKTVLSERRADVPLPPASITKLMTALVALDTWQDQNTILTVRNPIPTIGQSIALKPGNQLTVESLLQALLIHSGNDAALTLADNHSGGYAGFVAAMNTKAIALHLNTTTYKNPSGIDQHGHTTTARDIATLASVALLEPTIASIVARPRSVITDAQSTTTYTLESTDELLTTLPGLRGGKTGWTTSAGECFVAYVEREGRGIISVVLGSSDRFADTTKLVEWVYAHHSWIDPNPSL